MQTITTIVLDIAETVFQVHGVDAECNVVIRLACTLLLFASGLAVIDIPSLRTKRKEQGEAAAA
jgi:hypothetical protein